MKYSATLPLSATVALQRLLMFPIAKRKLLLPKEEMEEGWKIFVISYSDANTMIDITDRFDSMLTKRRCIPYGTCDSRDIIYVHLFIKRYGDDHFARTLINKHTEIMSLQSRIPYGMHVRLVSIESNLFFMSIISIRIRIRDYEDFPFLINFFR